MYRISLTIESQIVQVSLELDTPCSQERSWIPDPPASLCASSQVLGLYLSTPTGSRYVMSETH